ncbi:Enoyl-CoA hydratase [Heyndrickxia coagulans]|nr:Enoyl-CoA hydratase [Heyndrickxia coagulans]
MKKSVQKMEQDGLQVPGWVKRHAGKRLYVFYKEENGRCLVL